MAGSGVYWDDAAKDLQAFAERSGIPVFMNGAGRGRLPGDHPHAFSQARGWALGQADVVLVLGTPLDFRLGYGRPPSFAEDAQVVWWNVTSPSWDITGRWPWGSPGISASCFVRRRRVARGDGGAGSEWLGAGARRSRTGRPGSSPSASPTTCRSAMTGWRRDRGGDGRGDHRGGRRRRCRRLAAEDRAAVAPGQWLDPGPFGCLGVGPSFAMAAKLLRPGAAC